MRKFLLTSVAVAAFATTALAVPTPSQNTRSAADELKGAQVQDAQFNFGGRRHCWYARAWNGPGWYQCGYHTRRGHGWGGGDGWNGWRHR